MTELGMEKLILIPLVSAFIGWMTNWIAVKMLFHPKKPVKILFFVIQGIFHLRQKEIAKKLGSTIESKLLSHQDIQVVMKSDDIKQNLLPVIEEYINDFVSNRLVSIHPMMAMLPPDMVELIQEKLLEEIQNMLPDLLKEAGKSLESSMDIKETIRKKIENFDVSELEDILFSILKSEFKMIEYIGGILGFFIGVSQILIIKFL
ncbi:MAG: DUF445 family protein [Deltaproteobacteria bacterium]|jgi:uncharacterized membrane protein YheB (UPF0754 family)|nr:DUF445 family protein [Deltaproteobacteria bacterium]MBT4525821.1 DUF445 family protein [Deltaproteobacteria bacterium]